MNSEGPTPTPGGRRTRDTAAEWTATRIKLQFVDRQKILQPPAPQIPRTPAVQAPATPGLMLQVSTMSLQEVSLKTRLQDAVSSEGLVGVESPREKEDDEERAKQQRKNKKTELEEVLNVAKIHDSRILALQRDCWELEDVNICDNDVLRM